MKEEINHHRVAHGAYRFKIAIGLLAIFLSFLSGDLNAQCSTLDHIFNEGEKVEYDMYFKWGVLMPKAGNVSIEVKNNTFEGNPVWNTRLLAWSTGMVDKMFRVRDTINCYYSKSSTQLLYSSKRTNEGGYYQIDNLDFSFNNGETQVHSFRRSKNLIKIDTVLVSDICFVDLLGAIMHSRTIDWTNLQPGAEFPLNVAMGRTLINVSYRYVGQQIVERGNVKYRTRLFSIDIYDEAFTQSNEAAEIWIGDDDNHLPIKLRAKLKIGAAEAYYKGSSNLQYPLTCRIVMPAN